MLNKIESKEALLGSIFVGDEGFVEGGLVLLMVVVESRTMICATEGRGEKCHRLCYSYVKLLLCCIGLRRIRHCVI